MPTEQPESVGFRQMKDATAADYALLRRISRPFYEATADRLLRELERQEEEGFHGYRVSRLEHALQTATRALRDAADLDWIVAALLHDIGDSLAPRNHAPFAAEVLRPFLREECTWTVEQHGLFQTYYYAPFYGLDPDARDRWRAHPCYASCVDFCERWDQAAFDETYVSEPLAFFAPLVREVFARPPFDPAVLQPGVVRGVAPPSAASAA